jgi:two-component system, sensor histidine kinase SagS
LAYVPEPGIERYLRGYLEYSGASYTVFDDEDIFCAAIGDCETDTTIALVALSGSTSVAMREVALRVNALYPQQKVLTFTSHRGALGSNTSDVLQTVHWTPLLVSELWNALAHLAQVDFKEQTIGEQNPSDIRQISLLDGETLKLLVVEDNEINQIVITEQLRKIGLTADIAKDGVDGYKHWEKGNYDLILCDCHMPGMNGFAMTEKIREAEFALRGRRTPIIAITANALLGEADQCFAAGMDDYLSKPFALSDLRKAIAKWVD